jgi:glycosyltransferase involved in cell wall biosynthesis
MVSRLRRPKAPEDLIRAAGRLAATEKEDTFRVVFVGGGPLQAAAEALARRLGVDSRVMFLGDRLDVHALLPDVDIVVLASQAEGMPFSLLEGMAAGKPVVGSNAPGIDDLIVEDHNGYTYPRGDADELARILRRLLLDGDLRRRLGQAGRRMAESRFTSTRMVRETADLYEGLLRPPQSRSRS